jgi:hypothetical protein
MNRDKQLEEMRPLADEMGKAISNEYERRVLADERKLEAVLKENGWRKASEVASEIFEEIEKSIANLEYSANTPRKTVKVEELKAQVDWILHEVLPKTLAKLKKKYTEETTEGEG